MDGVRHDFGFGEVILVRMSARQLPPPLFPHHIFQQILNSGGLRFACFAFSLRVRWVVLAQLGTGRVCAASLSLHIDRKSVV